MAIRYMTYKDTNTGLEFRKVESEVSATINVFLDGNEVDAYTNYEVGDDMDRFVAACRELVKHIVSK